MIFNSVTYLLFLPAFLCAYWCAPQRVRTSVILLASVVFYSCWRPEFLAVMFVSATTDYFVALRLEKTQAVAVRRALVGVSLSVNLGLLLYFKYLLFVLDNAQAGLAVFGVAISVPHLEIVLPLGISFYTFEAISYTIDVYRRVIPAERSFLNYACFITFFPKLIAGPILRAAQLLPQFAQRLSLGFEDVRFGVERIFVGLFLKVVLADNIAPLVDEGFEQSVASMTALDVWTLAFLFGFQIYFDFAAYSSIAIGSSRMMGITLPENFNFPYMATSPRDFWKRWHISLSTWVRDYLYLPLLGVEFRARSPGAGLADELPTASESGARAIRVLLVTWAIMGMWHGANWTFVLWGVMHGVYVAGYRLTKPLQGGIPLRLRGPLGALITLPLVMLAWIPFRAHTSSDALAMIAKVFSPSEYLGLGMRENVYIIAASLLLLVLFAGLLSRIPPPSPRLEVFLAPARSFVVAAILFPIVMVFLRPINQFIYFQF